MDKTLKQLKEEMKRIQSCWNGKESGHKESRASVASEILDVIKEIEELLEEL